MSTGAIVAIIVGGIVLLGVIVILARRAGARGRAAHRREAGQLRRQAQEHTIQVESARASADEKAAQSARAEAEADEKAAQAKRAAAQAQQQASRAEHESEIVRAHHDRARSVDPDVGDDGEAEARALDERSAEEADEGATRASQ
jgi:biopolymer transport protein ExbB/TolQ